MAKIRACPACGDTLRRNAVQPGWVHQGVKGAPGCPLRIDCPTCRAFPGQWCVRPSEHKAMDLHTSRLTKAGTPA